MRGKGKLLAIASGKQKDKGKEQPKREQTGEGLSAQKGPEEKKRKRCQGKAIIQTPSEG